MKQLEQSETCINAALELKARKTESLVEKVRAEPTNGNVRLLARSLEQLRFDAACTFRRHGSDYREPQRFVAIGEAACDSASSVPEVITRTDGGDRSAHALIIRSTEELREIVRSVCAGEFDWIDGSIPSP